jgi:hypothetical protein
MKGEGKGEPSSPPLLPSSSTLKKSEEKCRQNSRLDLNILLISCSGDLEDNYVSLHGY